MKTEEMTLRRIAGTSIVTANVSQSGPAGDAGLAIGPGLSCRYDLFARNRLTELTVDIETVDPAELALVIGPKQASQVIAASPDTMTILPTEAGELLCRIAALDLYRALPITSMSDSVWAVEAALLWAEATELGFDVAEHIQAEVAKSLPVLSLNAPPTYEPSPIVARARELATKTLGIDSLPRWRIEAEQPDGEVLGIRDVLASLAVSAPAVPVGTFMGEDDLATYDQLWVHLPNGLFDGGNFSAIAFAERFTQRQSHQLRISVAARGQDVPQLFVRIVQLDGSNPAVRSVDAMSKEHGLWMCETPEPPDFDFGTHRIELVDRLSAALLQNNVHTKRRAQQWVLLGLASARGDDIVNAQSRWYLAQHMFESIGESSLADQLAKRISEGEQAGFGAFWAETADVMRWMEHGQ